MQKKNDDGRRQGTLPIVLSILALCVSAVAVVIWAWSFYASDLAPFDPLVTIGSVVWHPLNPADERGSPTGAPGAVGGPATQSLRKSMAVIVPITVTHRGGRPGVIEDIVLRLTGPAAGAEYLLVPQVLVDEREYFANFGASGVDTERKWFMGAFYPIAVAKGEQVHWFVLFIGGEIGDFNRAPFSPGRYTLRFLVKVSGHEDYVELDRRTETIAPQALADMLRGTRWVPVPSWIRELRKRVK
jgi:hypothetical protein